MFPLIESGQLCTVAPVRPEALSPGDIVLCRVNGSEYLHLVKAVRDGQYQIGNNKGRVNGWVPGAAIFGRLTKVEP